MTQFRVLPLVLWWLLLLGSAFEARAQATRPRLLTVERIEVEGNTRTSDDLVLDRLDLAPGDPADLEKIHAAADGLVREHLFSKVQVRTKPGSAPGQVVVVLQVKENRPHFRFGVGREDLSGIYLIPAQLNLDNITGSGEQLTLGLRLGYRVVGLHLDLHSKPPERREFFWRSRFRVEGESRIYFLNSTEVNQAVVQVGADFGMGVPVGDTDLLEATLSFDHVEPDSTATVYSDQDALGREIGDEIPFEFLPLQIQRDTAPRNLTRLNLAYSRDARRGVGLATSGIWGRVAGESVFSDEGNFSSLRVDLRGYRDLTDNLQLAGRLRAGTINEQAPFYERFYVGGLYTVRGFPSQSLTPPEGDLNMAAGSLELRRVWIGTPERPRVTGHLFVDAGMSWTGETEGKDPSVAMGYGIRIRVPWLNQIGVDIGVPLTDSPLEESFHGNFTIGWTF